MPGTRAFDLAATHFDVKKARSQTSRESASALSTDSARSQTRGLLVAPRGVPPEIRSGGRVGHDKRVLRGLGEHHPVRRAGWSACRVQGAGNLLGNLLCAVTGLLDGGGSLQRIVNLLNGILGAL